MNSGRNCAWILVSPRVVHAGRGSGVVYAIVTADELVIVRASASFRMRA